MCSRSTSSFVVSSLVCLRLGEEHDDRETTMRLHRINNGDTYKTKTPSVVFNFKTVLLARLSMKRIKHALVDNVNTFRCGRLDFYSGKDAVNGNTRRPLVYTVTSQQPPRTKCFSTKWSLSYKHDYYFVSGSNTRNQLYIWVLSCSVRSTHG